MSTIVVGYDGADGSDRILDRAIAEAQRDGGLVVVVAVLEMPLDPEGPQNFGSLDDNARMIPLIVPPELEPVLATARERLAAAGTRSDYLWAAGDPAKAIVGPANDRHADAVVVGRHHHSFLGRLFGTDVAAEVERGVKCPVIVVD